MKTEAAEAPKSKRDSLPYEITTIKSAKLSGDYYSVESSNGWGFSIDKKYNVVPKAGDTIETYGGIGHPIRGVCINGQTLFFKGELQMAAEHKAWVAQT